MVQAIHIEINILCLLILIVIADQTRKSVSQQMNRVLYRYTVYGIIFSLALDTVWMLIEGKMFPGAVLLNKVVNAVFLGTGTVFICIWYLYTLQMLGYTISRNLTLLVMAPAAFCMIINLISIKTGWIFYVTDNNQYMWGPGFPVQQVIVVTLLLIPLIHLIISFFTRKSQDDRKMISKMIGLYMLPVIGTLAALPYAGMPAAWPCAAIAIVLIYIDNQDSEILRDSLTGLNNRKTLKSAFAYYSKQTSDVKNLYVFMMDLDHFKTINDTYGHTAGDQALIDASRLLKKAVSQISGIVARYGGDEFLIMGFFNGESAVLDLKDHISADFEKWNLENEAPYKLMISIGYSQYREGQTLDEVVKAADESLYEEKIRRKSGR